MIIDALLRVSDSQALTSTGTTPSTNSIDLASFRDIAVGTDLTWVVSIPTTFTSGGAATLQVLAQSSVDNSSWTTDAQTDTFALATLTAGRLIKLKFPHRKAGSSKPRYIRLAYVIGTAAFTGGTVKADLVDDAPSVSADQYPAGINPAV